MMARRSYATLYYDTIDERDAWKALVKEAKTERDEWKARAEAETARANELEAALLMDYDELSAVIDTLQKRVAELEATAIEWHWGDELPPPYNWYLVFDWEAEDLDFAAMQVVWFDGEWSCDLTHWRKLPEAPRAAWAEAHRR